MISVMWGSYIPMIKHAANILNIDLTICPISVFEEESNESFEKFLVSLRESDIA